MPSFKQLWFQLHWFVGITAGTVLIVLGLSGAVFSFHEEILDWLNPGTARVQARSDQAPMTPAQLLQTLRAQGEERVVQRITVHSEAGRSAQISFKPLKGQRRGETVFVNPYTAAQLPPQKGAQFFEWAQRLHRWLLLSRDDGKPITGTLAGLLVLLSLSGLYLRWPRKPMEWRSWLWLDMRLKGRSFLWNLHAVAGTLALLVYLVLAPTGMYWAFDGLRRTVDTWAGVPPRAAAATSAKPGREPAEPTPDLTSAWQSFQHLAPGWQFAQLRVPERTGAPVQIAWFDETAAHERARNQLRLTPEGRVQQDERYADLPVGRRAVGAIYPLHMGTYFGLPGRIIVTLAALMMPLFAITGWLLYLDRRRKTRALNGERRAWAGSSPAGQGQDSILVAYASQTGHAERLALRTAAALRDAGLATTLKPMAQLDTEQLRHHGRALFIASSFGDGEAPDSTRRFARALDAAAANPLTTLHYGLLALGDRQYTRFCGFGRALDHQLQRLAAQPIFPRIEMDGEDGKAWSAWQQMLSGHFRTARQLPDAPAAPVFAPWTLAERSLINPGSLGTPLHSLTLTPPAGLALDWRPGALVEICPRHAPQTIAAWLQQQALDGNAVVRWQGRSQPLQAALSASVLPQPGDLSADASAQAVADALQPLAARSYSVASLPADGHVRLLVRQARHDAGLGLASGWLTAYAAPGAALMLRLVDNRAFAPVDDAAAPSDVPAIFIGNGSGYAGLRGHLLARMRAGQHRNWLLFGERQQAHDGYAQAEACAWLQAGQLARADFVYSRDQAQRRYVQDGLRDAADLLRGWIDEGAVIFICGSLQGMAAGVDTVLQELLGRDPLDELIAQGRYRRDAY